MESLARLLLCSALVASLGLAFAQEEEECVCVPYYQCDEDRRIITDGGGLIDPRIPQCDNAIDVCCRPPGPDGQPPIDPPQPNPDPDPYPDPDPNPNPGPDPNPDPFPDPGPDPNTPSPPDNGGGDGGDGGDYPNIPKPIVPQGSGCGLRRITINVLGEGTDYRITGTNGKAATTGFGEFPWTVAIFRTGEGGNKFVCAGSLIHPSVVLTAAHCLEGNEVGSVKVRAGDWDTQVRKEPIPHQDRGVSRLITHPQFNSKNLHYDIGLIILDHPFDLNESVDTICLPEKSSSSVDHNNCVATGWGKDAFGPEGKFQTVMRRVDLGIVERHECQKKLRTTRLGNYFILHEGFVCAGGEPEQDTCTGDGGGPLVCPIGPGRYAQLGIVSWGIGCGDSTPGVYTSVEHYAKWISQHLSTL